MRARRHVTRREQPFRFCHWLIALLVLCSPLLRLRLAGEGLVHAERVGQWLRARAARHAIQEAHATARIWARRVDRRLLGRQAPWVPREAPLLGGRAADRVGVVGAPAKRGSRGRPPMSGRRWSCSAAAATAGRSGHVARAAAESRCWQPRPLLGRLRDGGGCVLWHATAQWELVQCAPQFAPTQFESGVNITCPSRTGSGRLVAQSRYSRLRCAEACDMILPRPGERSVRAWSRVAANRPYREK